MKAGTVNIPTFLKLMMGLHPDRPLESTLSPPDLLSTPARPALPHMRTEHLGYLHLGPYLEPHLKDNHLRPLTGRRHRCALCRHDGM